MQIPWQKLYLSYQLLRSKTPSWLRQMLPAIWVPAFALASANLFHDTFRFWSFAGYLLAYALVVLVSLSRFVGFDVVSRRLHRETALSPSFSLPLYDLTESALIGVGLLIDGRLLWANRRMSQIFGYSLAQLLAMDSIEQLMAESEKEKILDYLQGEDGNRGESPFVFAGKNAAGEQLMLRAQSIWTVFNSESARLIMINDITAEELAKHQLVQEQHSYRQVLDSLREAVLQTDKDGRLILISGAWEKITGYSVKDCMYQRFDDFLEEGRRHRRYQQYQKILSGMGQFHRHRELFLHQDGSVKWVELNPLPMFDSDGHVVGSTCTLDDVTEVVEAEQARQRSDHRFRSLVETMNDGLGILDVNGQITYVNQKLANMLGLTSNDILGRRVTDFLGPRDRVKVKQRLRHTRRISAGAYEIAWQQADGNFLSSITSFQPQFDDQGKYIGGFAVITDITDQKREQGKLHQEARFDKLTGLSNRASFEQRLAEAIQDYRKKNQRFALLFLDLDGFKQVNDQYGHQFGDELLKVTAARLQTCVRPGDMVARFGGDEFCILIHINKEDSEAAGVADRIIHAIKAPFRNDGRLAQISTSIGIALCDANDNPKDLIQSADAALYQAKEGGKACFIFYDRRLMQRDQRMAVFSESLGAAIEKNQMHLVYQPFVDVADGSIKGFETLLRWNHPEFGLVNPREFLGVAESSGKIFDIGRWVLAQFAQQIDRWDQDNQLPSDVRFSLNVSSKEFIDPQFRHLLVQTIERFPVMSRYGVVEVLEDAVRRVEHDSVDEVKEPINMGICLDHFGAGMTQLAELNELDVDCVKLSAKLTRDIDRNEQQQNLVSAIIKLLHQLDVKVIATCLQTESETQVLRSLGCDWVQGNFIAEPMSAPEVQELLANANTVENWLSQLGSV